MSQGKSSGWAPETDEEAPADAGDGAASGVEADAEAETEPGIIELIQRIVGDGRAYAETELERQKLRATILGSAGRDTALLVLSALFLLFGALTTLLIGCVWMLAPLIGIYAALGLTLLAAFLIVFLLLIGARARMRNAVRIAFGKEDAE